VARIIRGYRSLVGGTGDADAGAGVHIVAAANEYDELVTAAGGPSLGRADAMRALRHHPARLRPDVLDALARVVAARPDAGQRRRRGEAASRAGAKRGTH
jgi:hypothetical protein